MLNVMDILNDYDISWPLRRSSGLPGSSAVFDPAHHITSLSVFQPSDPATFYFRVGLFGASDVSVSTSIHGPSAWQSCVGPTADEGCDRRLASTRIPLQPSIAQTQERRRVRVPRCRMGPPAAVGQAYELSGKVLAS